MKKYKWVIWLVVVVVLLLIVFRKNIFASASKGGIIYSNGNKIDDRIGIVKDTGEIIFLNKGEIIVNNKSASITDRFYCTGTPIQIISQISELGDGAKMADGGNCVKI